MTEHNFEQMRRAMVASSLRTTGINDPAVLAAISTVPRERFVPADRVAMAYADTLVPLRSGRELNSPMSLGRMLTEAAPSKTDRALVVGAATGYAAAVLEQMVSSVVAVEEDPELLAFAREALAGSSVKLIEGPLTKGYADGAPYDLIVLDGAVEFVPDEIVVQLAETGRLAAATLNQGVASVAIGRRGGTGFGMAAISDVASAILPGFQKPRGFEF